MKKKKNNNNDVIDEMINDDKKINEKNIYNKKTHKKLKIKFNLFIKMQLP